MRLLFDNDCGLCTHCVEWLQKRARGVQFEPLAASSDSIVLVLEDGTELAGAPAVAMALRSCGGVWRLAGQVMALPGVAALAAVCYRFVAARRAKISTALGWNACSIPQAK